MGNDVKGAFKQPLTPKASLKARNHPVGLKAGQKLTARPTKSVGGGIQHVFQLLLHYISLCPIRLHKPPWKHPSPELMKYLLWVQRAWYAVCSRVLPPRSSDLSGGILRIGLSTHGTLSVRGLLVSNQQNKVLSIWN